MAIIDLTIPLSFSDTLGSLMKAVIDAQAQSARATVEFIQEVGTEEGTLDFEGEHNLRNIKFKYSKLNENAESSEFILEVPLLSIVDIPMVSVKSAKFNFKYDITSSTESEPAPPSSANISTESGGVVALGSVAQPFPIKRAATIKGRVHKSTRKTDEKGGIDVEIILEKPPLPAGLDRIMDMLELAASEKNTNNQ